MQFSVEKYKNFSSLSLKIIMKVLEILSFEWSTIDQKHHCVYQIPY